MKRLLSSLFLLAIPLFSFVPNEALAASAADSFTVTIQIGSTTPATTTPTTTTSGTTAPPSGGGSPGSFGGPGDTFSPNQITRLEVTAGIQSAHIEWDTSKASNHIFRYGKTPSYELATIVNSTLQSSHIVDLTGLESDTLYYFSVESTSGDGQVASDQNESFLTLTAAAEPANVSNFSAFPSGQAVALQWQNPSGVDIDSVRIVRSTQSFPQSPTDGSISFEGVAEDSTDTDVSPGITYFYTAFVRATNGIYSSGAIAQVTMPASGLPPEEEEPGVTEEPELPPGELPPGEQPEGEVPPGEDQDLLGEDLGEPPVPLDGIDVSQEGTDVPLDGQNFEVGIDEPITFAIPADQVPSGVQQISLIVRNPDGTASSFLLRLSPDGGSYRAVIPGLEIAGRYVFDIVFSGFDNNEIGRVRGVLTVAPGVDVGLLDFFLSNLLAISGIIILILVVSSIALYLLRRLALPH